MKLIRYKLNNLLPIEFGSLEDGVIYSIVGDPFKKYYIGDKVSDLNDV